MTAAWTAFDVCEALIKAYLDGWGCANYFEFEMPSDEYDHDQQRSVHFRRADLLTVFASGVHHKSPFVRQRDAATTPESHAWFRSLPWGWRTAFEIKVSRADFRADARSTWKHTPIRRVVNEMFFVYPRGLIRLGQKRDYTNKDDDLIPNGAGAIEVYRDERKRWLGSPRARIVRAPTATLLAETTNEFVMQLVARTLRARSCAGLRALEERRRNPLWWKGVFELVDSPAAGAREPAPD